MGTKANQVPRLELFVQIAKTLELEATITEENNALSVDVSKDQINLKVIFGDFKKVRIWKKFAFTPSNIMEEYRRAEELLKPLAHAFSIEWHVVKKKIANLWPTESQTDQNFLLEIVLDNLEKDHAFLLKGDVFTPDLIETWIDYKRKNEVDPIRLRPHPWEFALYFDI